MDGPGGCCLLRYAGDAGVASKVEWIMLRFRPIAPKPVSPGESPPCSSPVTEAGESTGRAKVRGTMVRRRGKREGVGRRGRKRRAPHTGERVTKRVVTRKDLITLQLMPEMPERKETAAAAAAAAASMSAPLPDLAPSYAPTSAEAPGTVMAPTPVWSAASWVTLESVTETCQLVGEERRRCTWAEARRALEGDACPAFLSDASDWVAWTNAAYRNMVGLVDQGGVVSVALETRGRVPTGAACGAFSCRARVRYACPTTGERGSMTVPCDVWRLAEDGWLAWRLDMKAALRLGI